MNLQDNTTRSSKSSKFRKYEANNITELHSRFYPISTSQDVINIEVENSTTMNQKLKNKKKKKKKEVISQKLNPILSLVLLNLRLLGFVNRELVMDREARRAAVHGVVKS